MREIDGGWVSEITASSSMNNIAPFSAKNGSVNIPSSPVRLTAFPFWAERHEKLLFGSLEVSASTENQYLVLAETLTGVTSAVKT